MIQHSQLIESAQRTIRLEVEAVQQLSSRIGNPFIKACELILQSKGRVVVVSNALLVANFKVGSSMLFAIGVGTAATAHGLCLLAGISMVNHITSPAQRSGLISTYLVCGYVGSIVPLLVAGWIADHFGLPTAITALGLCVVAVATPIANRPI